MTTPQEEAERRWPDGDNWYQATRRVSFEAGADWLAAELGLTPEQVQRLGPLVEAARAYRAEFMATGFATNAAVVAVLAAAAALDEEGGE